MAANRQPWDSSWSGSVCANDNEWDLIRPKGLMTDDGVQHDTAACPMMPLDLCVVSQKVLSRILFASFYFSHPFAFCILFITTATTTVMRLSAANASIYRGTLAIPSVEAPSTVRRIDFHHTASNSHEDVSLFNACVDALIQSEDIILGSSF